MLRSTAQAACWCMRTATCTAPSLVPFGHRIPVAPHYLLKLKSCDAIRMVRLPQVLRSSGRW